MRKDLVQLAFALVQAKSNPNHVFSYKEKTFTVEQLNQALRDEVFKLASNYNDFRRNKLDIFELVQQTVDLVLPNRVRQAIGQFADVRTFAQGQKPIFNLVKGKSRAKSFVTKVGLSGIYESFELDRAQIEVPSIAYGGAARLELERFLDGVFDFSDFTDIIIEGLEDKIYYEIQTALVAAISSMPAINTYSGAAFDDAEMITIINAMRAYGNVINIFCTPVFAGTIIPDSGFVGDMEKADLRNQGYVGRFYGANVIILPQSFTDETNATTVFDDSYAFIIPSGNEKIVKVALEGQTIVDDVTNADRSMEFQAYKKMGSAICYYHTCGAFTNTAL